MTVSETGSVIGRTACSLGQHAASSQTLDILVATAVVVRGTRAAAIPLAAGSALSQGLTSGIAEVKTAAEST